MSRAETLSRMRRMLCQVAADGLTITYRDLGRALALEPPGVIRRVAVLLEASMTEDAHAGRPFLAAVVVSRTEGLPRRGFFERAGELGRFRGDPEGPEARDFFQGELQAARAYWVERG